MGFWHLHIGNSHTTFKGILKWITAAPRCPLFSELRNHTNGLNLQDGTTQHWQWSWWEDTLKCTLCQPVSAVGQESCLWKQLTLPMRTRKLPSAALHAGPLQPPNGFYVLWRAWVHRVFPRKTRLFLTLIIPRILIREMNRKIYIIL